MNAMRSMSAWMSRHLDNLQERSNLMGEMMRRLDVDVEGMASADLGMSGRKVASRCRSCPSEKLCRRWLAGEEPGLEYGEFCQNRPLFESFRRH